MSLQKNSLPPPQLPQKGSKTGANVWGFVGKKKNNPGKQKPKPKTPKTTYYHHQKPSLRAHLSKECVKS